MKSMFHSIRQYMLMQSDISTAIEGGIWPIQVPKIERHRPAVSIQVIAKMPYNHLTGVPTAERATVRVKVLGTPDSGFTATVNAAETIRANFVGRAGTWDGLIVQAVIGTGMHAEYIDPETGDWTVVKDYFVFHEVMA